MKLIPSSLAADLPRLYATQHDKDPIARVKLFTPWSNWTWYITEYDGEDVCFGLVQGHEDECGYFSLDELAKLRGPAGLRVERDLNFQPTPLSQIGRTLRANIPPTDASAIVTHFAERLLEREVFACQSSLIDKLMANGLLDGFDWDSVENLYEPQIINRGDEDGPKPRDIYEWWLVSAFLARQLRHQAEPILENEYGFWWGRTCTGQMMLLDGTFQAVARKLLSH